jgi:uncharacterized protein YqiB (DUF1249 family)
MRAPPPPPPEFTFQPTVGAKWYVVAPGRRFVQLAKITETTKHTVLVEFIDEALTLFGLPAPCVRYVIKDVRWVERIADTIEE